MTHTQDSAPRCETCRYFERLECRRNAPIPSQMHRQPLWPTPRRNDWCGEHSPRATLRTDEGEK